MKKPEIKELSVYIFSEENFNRSKKEISWLNEVYKSGLADLLKMDFIHENKCRVNMISTRPKNLDGDVLQLFNNLRSETKIYGNKVLNILVGYTGKREILRSVSSPLNRIKNLFFGLKESDIEKSLEVKSPCDFIIRSSEEEAEREAKSGFLLWQSAYSEYYHLNKNWGDVTIKDLERAWQYFLNTNRAHGL